MSVSEPMGFGPGDFPLWHLAQPLLSSFSPSKFPLKDVNSEEDPRIGPAAAARRSQLRLKTTRALDYLRSFPVNSQSTDFPNSRLIAAQRWLEIPVVRHDVKP